jgi:hypothetical protein
MHLAWYQVLLVILIVFGGFTLTILVLIGGIRGSVRAGEAAALMADRHKLLAKGAEGVLTVEDGRVIEEITFKLIAQAKNARLRAALEAELSRATSARMALERGDLDNAQKHLADIGRRVPKLG